MNIYEHQCDGSRNRNTNIFPGSKAEKEYMELMQSEGWELVTPLYREGVWHYPMKDKEEEMFSTYNQTVDEIANTIYSLRTHKRVEDGFPEAFPFLPDRIGSTEMVIQLQPTRDKVTTLLGLKSATHE